MFSLQLSSPLSLFYYHYFPTRNYVNNHDWKIVMTKLYMYFLTHISAKVFLSLHGHYLHLKLYLHISLLGVGKIFSPFTCLLICRFNFKTKYVKPNRNCFVKWVSHDRYMSVFSCSSSFVSDRIPSHYLYKSFMFLYVIFKVVCFTVFLQ